MVGRAVLGTPYEGVFGLLDWAADNWPYVNGKALYAGLSLKELEASEMLDVLHYLFEDDLRVASGEMADAIAKSRSSIYRLMYKRDYRSGFTSSDTKYNMSTASGTTFSAPPTASSATTKPYIPPTQFDPDSFAPFGDKLDAPLK